MFKNNQFVHVVHYAHGAQGSGASPDDAKPIASGEVCNVPEGVVITDAEFQVVEAIAGATAMDFGDGVDPNGYVEAADITYATPGGYVGTGALLKKKKYAAEDTVDLAVTGASSAGKGILILRGYRV